MSVVAKQGRDRGKEKDRKEESREGEKRRTEKGRERDTEKCTRKEHKVGRGQQERGWHECISWQIHET